MDTYSVDNIPWHIQSPYDEFADLINPEIQDANDVSVTLPHMIFIPPETPQKATTSRQSHKRQHCTVRLRDIVLDTLNNPDLASTMKWIKHGETFQINWKNFFELYKTRGKSTAQETNIKNRFTRKNTGFKREPTILPDQGYDTVYSFNREFPPNKKQRQSKNTEQFSMPLTPPTTLSSYEFQSPQLPVQPYLQQAQPLAQFSQTAEHEIDVCHIRIFSDKQGRICAQIKQDTVIQKELGFNFKVSCLKTDDFAGLHNEVSKQETENLYFEDGNVLSGEISEQGTKNLENGYMCRL